MTTDIKKVTDHDIVVETTTINGKDRAQAFTKDQLEAMLENLAPQGTAQKHQIDVQIATQTTRISAMLSLLTPKE